jgi:hypothetical protein
VTSRYKTAHDEIRSLVERNPKWSAKRMWDELTTHPVPSMSTIFRVMQRVKRELIIEGKVVVNALDRSAPSDTLVATAVLPLEIPNMDKLDEVLGAVKAMCDGMGARMDAIAAEQKVLADRLDAAGERERADAAAAQTRNDAAEDKHAFADAQIKADAAYNAWGKQAPHALSGESLRDFRVRLLTELQPLCRAYKDSDLRTVGDERAFAIIEGQIIADAIKASNEPDENSAGRPLRKVSSRHPDTGHSITKFYGDPAVCWAPFACVPRRGRIVRQDRH